jgi:hypothetical protein
LGNALDPSAEPLAALYDEWRQARAIAIGGTFRG